MRKHSILMNSAVIFSKALRLDEESSDMLFSSTALPLRTPLSSSMQDMGNSSISISGGSGAVQLNPLTAPSESSPPPHFISKSNSSSKVEVPRLKPPSPATSAPSTRPLQHPQSLPMSHIHDGNISISSSMSSSRERDRDRERNGDVLGDVIIRQCLSADNNSISTGSGKRTI